MVSPSRPREDTTMELLVVIVLALIILLIFRDQDPAGV
jgi:hypothetical protein